MSAQVEKMLTNAGQAVRKACLPPDLETARTGMVLAIIRDFQPQRRGDLVHSTIRDIAWLVGHRFDTGLRFDIGAQGMLRSTDVDVTIKMLRIAGFITSAHHADGYVLSQSGADHYSVCFARRYDRDLAWQMAVAAVQKDIAGRETYEVVAERLDYRRSMRA